MGPRLRFLIPEAFVLAIAGALVFAAPALPTTTRCEFPAAAGEVTSLSAGHDGSVWLAIATTRVTGGTHSYRTAIYTTSAPGRRWKKVLEAPGRRSVGRLWFFGPGRMVVWLGGGPTTGGTAQNTIMRTEDGGVRWHSIGLPSADYKGSTGSFITPVEAWAQVGTGTGMNSLSSILYHTLDGGDHWTELAQAVAGKRSHSGLTTVFTTGIEFRDAKDGWVGTNFFGTMLPIFYMTTDGGVAWNQQWLSAPAQGPDHWTTGEVSPPRFFNGGAGVAVALLSNGKNEVKPFAYRSSNGGRTWSDPRPFPARQGPTDSLAWDVLSPTVWAVAENQTLWVSSNAGLTWSVHPIPLAQTYQIVRIALSAPKHVWLIAAHWGAPWRLPNARCVLLT